MSSSGISASQSLAAVRSSPPDVRKELLGVTSTRPEVVAAAPPATAAGAPRWAGAPRENVLGATVPILALEPPRTNGALPRAAARQPTYPFSALNAADSVRLYTSTEPSCRGAVGGRSFSPDELRELGRALFDVAPLLRCPNHPARYIARIDIAVDKKENACVAAPTTMGSHTSTRGFVTVTDRATVPKLRGTTIHEVVHTVLQEHDPRACTNHPGRASPLMADWARRMGWDATWSFIERPLPGERPPTTYAEKNAMEDMAESYEMYFTDPARLRTASRTRYRAVEELIAQLKALGDVPRPPSP